MPKIARTLLKEFSNKPKKNGKKRNTEQLSVKVILASGLTKRTTGSC